MSYDAIEKSVNPNPVELYRFVGTDVTYLMTSSQTNITVESETYVATTISRDAVKVGTHENDDVQLTVSVPVNHPMVSEYMFNVGPPDLELHLYRIHRSDLTDKVTYWTGEVTSFSVEGRTAKLLVPSMFSYFLNGLLPAPRYQGPCNHVLFDEFCKLSRVGNEHEATITAINGLNITLSSSIFDTNKCKAGEMILHGRGQRRMIISNTGNVFRISYPFMTPKVGDIVTVTIGCDHSFTTCKELLNGVNYGGFPFVPNRNPYNGRI